jgi:AcrR family transcriptional regulator
MSAQGGLRNEILKAGAKILSSAGFGRLTQPEISKHVGITQSRLTYYFPKRADLLIGVVDYAINVIAKEVVKHAAQGSAVSSKHLFALVSWIIRDRKRTQLILNIFFESQESPELKKRLKRIVLEHQAIVASALGPTADESDAAIVLAVIWGLCLQHYILASERTDEDATRILERFETWLHKAVPATAEH